MIRLHRHRYGPRVYVLGYRVHEWQLGAAVLVLAVGGVLVGGWHFSVVPAVAVVVGGWLILKDWRDIVPSKRDTSAWQLGLHRRAVPLREARRADAYPRSRPPSPSRSGLSTCFPR